MSDLPLTKTSPETRSPRAGLSPTVSAVREAVAVALLLFLDLAAMVFSLGAAFTVRIYLLSRLLPGLSRALLSSTLDNIWWMPLIAIFALAYEKLYSRRLPFWTEVKRIVRALTLAVIISVLILYLSKLSENISRPLVVLVWLGAVFLVPLFRFAGKQALIRCGLWSRAVLLAGSGDHAALVARALAREKTMGYTIAGILTGGEKTESAIFPALLSFARGPIPVLGTLDDADRVIAATGVREVILVSQGAPPEKLVELSNRFLLQVNSLILVPDLFGLPLSGLEVTSFLEEQALLLHVRNRLKSSFNRTAKRAFDLTAGTVLLVLFVPLLLLAAAVAKFNSPGPVFFRQERMGQGGRIFHLLKFRTMHPDNERLLHEHLAANAEARREWAEFNKLRGYDPRVTRGGWILRRFSLDELPQLIHVIAGRMSLVGPRPYLPREKEQIGRWLDEITVAKPGLTGLWQVSGRNRIDFAGRLYLDVLYMRNWSLWLDLIVLLKTIGVVLQGQGAH